MKRFCDHVVLIGAVCVFCGPVIWVLASAVTPGFLFENWQTLTERLGAEGFGPGITRVILVSFLAGLGTSLVSTALSFLTAYALTFWPVPIAGAVFWVSIATLFFPIEARMLHTFDVMVRINLVNSYTGLILPILQLALGTFFFRQHFRKLPPALLEAARLDGAGPLRFLVDFAVPLSRTPIVVVSLIAFIWGWNQYLWPLMISIDNRHWTLVRALEQVGVASGAGLLLAALSLAPPLVLVLVLQYRLSVKESMDA